MESEDLAVKIINTLNKELVDTKWSVCDLSDLVENKAYPISYDPFDLKPTVLIMEDTESGERLRFSIKISDCSKENKK